MQSLILVIILGIYFFGIVISILIFITSNHKSFMKALWLIICLIFIYLYLIFIYLYLIFIYKSIAEFIMSDNIFFFNCIVFLVAKFIAMIFCYLFAIFIAPVELVYLHFYHSKNFTYFQIKLCLNIFVLMQ